MTDSLLINNQIELWGNTGGTVSSSPLFPGAIFRLGQGAGPDGGSYDFGTPQPTQDYVASLLLDGERPFGYRASNRTISLPLTIRGPTRAIVAAATEHLLETIDAQTWTLTWTRDPATNAAGVALPMVFSCFRAQPSVVKYGFAYNRFAISQLTITFPALPYGASDTPQTLTFAAPASVGGSAPPAPVVLDNYSTVSGSGFTQSSQCAIGPHSAHWASGGGGFPTYTKTFLPMPLTGLTAVSAWIGLGATSFQSFRQWTQGPAIVVFTLTDVNGAKLTFSPPSKKAMFAASNNAAYPKFRQVWAPIPPASQSSTGSFDFANCTGYSISCRNYSGGPYGDLCTHDCYFDNIQCIGNTTLAAPASVRGWIYNLNGVLGTAHAPISLQAQQPSISAPVTVVLTGSGQWIPPAGVSVAAVYATGGGGAGFTELTTGAGGGGCGGELAGEPALAITSSAPIPYSCGAGGIPQASSGSTAVFTTPGNATWTCPPGVTTLNVIVIAAGAAGSYNGPGGAGGEYAQNTTYAVTPGQVYQIVVGQGGNPFGEQATAGGNSSFDLPNGGVVAHGGSAGRNGASGTVPGGTGSTAPVHHNGGAGGANASGYAGGGGGGSGGTSAAGNAGGSSSGGSGGSGGSAVSGGAAGGGGGGYSSNGSNGNSPGGGGGAAGYNANDGGQGGNGSVSLAWTPAASAPVDGGTTTFGPASAALVTAYGGHSATSATGATTDTGTSANTVVFAGGTGANGVSTTGGGGGSGAGTAAVGGNASGATAGTPPAGGGWGGIGSTGTGAGSPGSAPGGGGGGSVSAGTPMSGGAGGAGEIVITYTATLAPFSTLIAHRPGPMSPLSLTPFVSTNSASDVPNGSIQYPVPSLIAGQNARFGGTYSVWLVGYNWDTPANARLVTVTVYEYEYVGGPSTSTSVSRTVTPNNDVASNMVDIGTLTLPNRDMAPDNTTAYFTVSITSGDVSDQFLDVLFLDTMGETVILATPQTYVNFYLDEPGSDRDIGRMLGSAFDRSEAVSVLDSALAVSGGPLTVDPGNNVLLGYSVQGAPALVATYNPRWYLDRLV